MKSRVRLVSCVIALLLVVLVPVAISCKSSPAQEETRIEEEQETEDQDTDLEEDVEDDDVEEAGVEEQETGATGISAIPHTLEGREDCLLCHGEGAIEPYPANHVGRTSDTCTTCHQPAQ